MKKKILFVINTLGKAGAEIALLELLKQLNDLSYEVSLYVLLGQGELIHQLPPHVKLLNESFSDQSVLTKDGHKNILRTVKKAAVKKANWLRLMSYMISGLTVMIKNRHIQKDKLLWRMVSDGASPQKEYYDLAVSYLEGGAAYYVADHVKARKKAAFIHIDYSRAGYSRQLDKNCYLNYDRIFTVSGEVRDHFLKIYPECSSYTRIFHNMIDQTSVVNKSEEPGGFQDSYDGIRLLTVGRLEYQKAFDIAVDVMDLLKKKECKVRWYILGEGTELKRLERRIEKAGLTKEFILMGAVNNPYPYYKQTDIYVHATRFEGKSIAIQEAQLLGCAILASDCSGNREQIESGKDGLLCELKAEKIAEGILYLIENPEIRERFSLASKRKETSGIEDIKQLTELLTFEK